MNTMPQNIECFVTLPDSVLYNITLSLDATGYDCLLKVCQAVGVVEHDYFGLRYTDHHGLYLWINTRLRLNTQIKASPPYQLHLRVKYFVDPSMLQQPTTKHLFFLQAKAFLKDGKLPVNREEASKIGAFLAQAEMGDSLEDESRDHHMLCYPQYFNDWDVGIARAISQEHTQIKGMSAVEAEMKALEHASKLSSWGVNYVRVTNTEDDSPAYIGIGGGHITLCNNEWKTLKRLSYSCLQEASFRNKIFNVCYKALNREGQTVDKKISVECSQHRIARYLFRMLTEDHCFFTHETVSRRVHDHVRYRPWHSFCRKYFRIKFERYYHFDVLKTQHEVYAHVWETLHQVSQEQLNATVIHTNRSSVTDSEPDSRRGPVQHNIIAINHSSSEPGSARNSDASSITVNLTRIGFSKSSCDIAKELLESSVENIDEESNTESNYDGNHMAKPIRPFSLTKEGTVKVKQLLYKIHDSKLCRVCMDEPASAVFCPCGHLVSCYSCALACMKCPLCRREVAYVQYVYNSGL